MTPLPSNQNEATPKPLPDHWMTAENLVWTQADLPEKGLGYGVTYPEIVLYLAERVHHLLQNTHVVEGLDTSNLNLMGQQAPFSQRVLLQKILDKLGSRSSGGTTPVVAPPVSLDPLPDATSLIPIEACLQSLDANGDTVEALPYKDYIALIAKQLCNAIEETAKVVKSNESILKLVEKIPTSNTGTGAKILIQFLALRGTNQKYEIPEAFAFVEQNLINHKEDLGAEGALEQAAKLQNEIGLDAQLSGEELVKQLPGWNANAVAIPDQLSNIWIALRDVRTYLQSNPSNPTTPVHSEFVLDFALEFSSDRSSATLRTSGLTKIPFLATACGEAQLSITDGTNTHVYPVDLPNLTLLPAGQNVNLSSFNIDATKDLTAILTGCILIDGDPVQRTKTKIFESNCALYPVTDITTILTESTQLGFSWPIPDDSVTAYRVVMKDTTGTYHREQTVTINSVGFTELAPFTTFNFEVSPIYPCGIAPATTHSAQTLTPGPAIVMCSFTNSTDKSAAYMRVRIVKNDDQGTSTEDAEVFPNGTLSLEAFEGDSAVITVYTGEPGDQDILGQMLANGVLHKQISAKKDGKYQTFQFTVTANNSFDWSISVR